MTNEIIQVICLVGMLGGMFALGYIVKGIHLQTDEEKSVSEWKRYNRLTKELDVYADIDNTISTKDLKALNDKMQKGIDNNKKNKYVQGDRRRLDNLGSGWGI